MSHWTSELRYATRKLVRSPGFTLVAALTLALGIGATTAIFSVVNAVLLRPLPFHQPERLVGLWHSAPGIGIDQFEQSEGTYLTYRDETHSFTGIAAYRVGAVNLSATETPERVGAAEVTASFAPVLGVQPVLGRWIAEEEDAPGRSPVAVIGEGLWRRRFGGDRGIIGRAIRIDGVSHEIVGIMPGTFRFPNAETQLWTPMAIDRARAAAFDFNMNVIARLETGISHEDAQRDLQRVIPRLIERYPTFITKEMFAGMRLSTIVHSLRDDVVGDVARVLWVILGTAGFVLLIACANVANLFVVRSEGRQKEVAVRTALGAGTRDVVRFALAESLLLAALGGIAGLSVAVLGTRLLAQLGPQSLPRLAELSIDSRVMAVAALVTVLAGLLFSLFPVLRYRVMSLAVALKESGRGATSGRERHRTRSALVVAQVALALVLLAGAGLMARSFSELRRVDPGFDPSNVLTVRLALTGGAHADDAARARFYSQLVDRVRSIPGVREAAIISKLPLLPDGNNNTAAFIEDQNLGPNDLPGVYPHVQISDGYFETMGISLLAGRSFETRERERGSDGVVISEALARKVWKDPLRALGRRVRTTPRTPWYTVIGVVKDVHSTSLDQTADEMVYYPMRPAAGDTVAAVRSNMSVVLRTAGDPMGALAAVRREVAALDAGLPLFNVRTMDDVMRASTARTSFTLLLLSIASAVALVLGAVGIYGVISYLVSLRTREIGVRMAFGARARDVGWLVTRQGLVLAAIGVVIGVGASIVVTRALGSLLYGVAPGDPLTLGAAALALLVAAVAASALPALRATRMDPVQALRSEG
jgi:putative ABC transport system permease protein